MKKTITTKSIPLFKVFMPPETSKMVADTINSGFIAEGEKVKLFTQKIVEFIGNPRVVPVNSCTTALTIAFKLSGVSNGTEVITTPLTCVAGNEPIKLLGGTPVWADVDRETGMVTAETIEPLITSKTRAIYILHKEGAPAEIEDIYKLAKKYKLRVVEDAAHAFGAMRKGKKIGSMGDFVCFSFQAIKHITTGDGGALLCGNQSDYECAKKIKWFGIDRDAREGRDVWREDIQDWGLKGNMNDISATIGISQIKHINFILHSFHENGRRYDELLSNVTNVKTLKRNLDDYQTYWAYTFLVENRKEVISELAKEGVSSSQIHVRNDHYSMFNSNSSNLENTNWFDQRELAIPCGWWIDSKLQERIVEIIKKVTK